MSAEETRDQILGRLILDENETLHRLRNTVGNAEKLFKFDLKSRTVVLSDFSVNKLSMKEKVSVYLIARYVGANVLELSDKKHFFESDSVTLADTAAFFGKKTTAISGRFTELIGEGLVERTKTGEYRFHHHKVEATLESLASKAEVKT